MIEIQKIKDNEDNKISAMKEKKISKNIFKLQRILGKFIN